MRAPIEEAVFYAAVKDALKDELLVPDAQIEYASVEDLIAQLEGVEPDGAKYDAKVKVLSEHVKHHGKEEHDEMFPKARASSLDMVELGARMAARKDESLAWPPESNADVMNPTPYPEIASDVPGSSGGTRSQVPDTSMPPGIRSAPPPPVGTLKHAVQGTHATIDRLADKAEPAIGMQL